MAVHTHEAIFASEILKNKYMKKLGMAMLFVSAVATAQMKKVVSSDINWWGYKIAKSEASSHYGDLKIKNGSVLLKNNQIAAGTFVLDMNSINSNDLTGEYQAKLNGHLKTGDFFETNKYPTAVFKILSVKKSGKAAFPYTVAGNLTAKGKTNPVAFPAKISMMNGVLNFVSDKFTIDRQKWDIAYKSTMEDVVVKDEIDIQINFTAK